MSAALAAFIAADDDDPRLLSLALDVRTELRRLTAPWN